MHLFNRFFPLSTIRGQIFLAFAVMSGLTAAIGGYEVLATAAARRVVIDTYDRPLMSINFARAASLAFSQMENEVLRMQISGVDQREAAKLKDLSHNFFEDLAVAKQRAMSPEAVNAAQKVRELVQHWDSAAAAIAEKNNSPNGYAGLAKISSAIIEEFDRLIEFTAEDGFRERQRSLNELSRVTNTTVAYSVLAMLLAASITFLLGRRILRPLSAAARVADRIAEGDLKAELPAPGRDEIGSLLRSMGRMQVSINMMMEREEGERRSAQRRLLHAVEGSRDAMMVIDRDGRIILANTEVSRILGVSPADIVPGRSYQELVSRVAYPYVDPAEAPDLLATEGEVCLRPNLWLRISCTPTDEGGIFLFWADISELKQREDNLFRAKQAAEAASQAKSRFLATMSHELRTPLNAIIGFSEMIAAELCGPVGNLRYREYGGNILRSGRHLLQVIGSVLDYAKAEAGQATLHCENIDLTEVVSDVLDMCGDQCKHLHLEYRPTSYAVPIMGDAQKLRQMLLNLLSNAAKFTPAEGRIWIHLSKESDRRVLLEIGDTGIGMDPGDIAVALTPFGQIDSRLSRNFEGTGLGLPLAKSFAEMHGATFSITSEPSRGTTVSIRFPCSERRDSEHTFGEGPTSPLPEFSMS